jgi:hypothetical protein
MMTLEEILQEFDEEFKPISACRRCWADCYDEPCTCESSVKDQEHHNEKVKAFIQEKFKEVEKAVRYYELAKQTKEAFKTRELVNVQYEKYIALRDEMEELLK